MTRIVLKAPSIDSFSKIPASTTELMISDASFFSLTELSPILKNLEILVLENFQNLTLLTGIPEIMPQLTHLRIKDCHSLQSISNLPTMPKLKLFTLKNTSIRNFAGLHQLSTAQNRRCVKETVRLKVISPYGIPFLNKNTRHRFHYWFNYIKHTLKHYPEEFPASYLEKIDFKRLKWTQIIQFFKEKPTTLVLAFVNQTDNPLSQFNQDRIWAEVTFSTFQVLNNQVSPADPILMKLANRLKIPLKIGTIFK